MNIEIQANNIFVDYLKNWHCYDYVIFGGYGSSKSYHTALKILLKTLKEKRRVLITRQVANTLKESCYALFKEIIFNYNLEPLFHFTLTPMKITSINGSEIIFVGLDNPSKLKSVHDIDIVWLEESADISFDAYKELNGRLRTKKDLHIFLTFNPISKNSWIYKHYFKDRNINEENLYKEKKLIVDKTYYMHSVATDNKFLNDEYIKRLKDMENYDPDLYRIAFLGHFGYVGERVFTNWEEMPKEEINIRINKLSQYGVGNLFDGLDLGFSISYNALIRCAIDRENNYLYIYDETYNKGLINSELIMLIRNKFNKKYNRLIVDSSRPELIEEMVRNGIRAYPSIKGAGSVLDGLQKIKSFNKVYISSSCKQTLEDFREFSHKKDKDGNFIEDEFNIDSHTLDAIRYAIEEYRPIRLKGGKINDNDRTD
ncbi:MAG: PBSX family phage terminase large subunit [Fusobacterium gastrosuis]|uniref:PBSX family phage terminase large subunit n=1 Tax=Fusobacterium gastrosuis TaxID=1755100 RepID=UPI002A8DE2D9|nr:PBSX family phage terminase large subunit [Fusobacterium gastrosuis]